MVKTGCGKYQEKINLKWIIIFIPLKTKTQKTPKGKGKSIMSKDANCDCEFRNFKRDAKVHYMVLTEMNESNEEYFVVDMWIDFDFDEEDVYFTSVLENHGNFKTEAEANAWILNHEIDWEDAFAKYQENF